MSGLLLQLQTAAPAKLLCSLQEQSSPTKQLLERRADCHWQKELLGPAVNLAPARAAFFLNKARLSVLWQHVDNM